MSLSYSTRSVIGGKFDQGVEDQLELRKSVINKVNTRTTDDVKYLTSTTGWVRVISSVDTQNTDRTYTSETAKKYILLGGILDSYSGFNPGQPGSSYTKSSEYGFIPTAGITSFQVQSKGTFGTLRTASFNFTVNSPEDFSKLEQLYLRPGFSILLEWGHSYHLSNSEKRLIPTSDLFPLNDFLNKNSDTVIESKIQSLKEKSNSYNYDGMFGIIKNFIWNYNGYTYECQVDVVSKGEVVESVKTAMAPLTQIKQNPDSADIKYEGTQYGSELLAFLNIISYAPTSKTGLSQDAEIKQRLNTQNSKLSDRLFKKYQDVTGKTLNFLVTFRTHNYSIENSTNKYITLRCLLILVNEISLIYNDDNPLVAFNVGENNTKNTFTTFSNHFGLDLGICVLPRTLKSIGLSLESLPQPNNTDDILDIFVSVNYLISVLTEFDLQSDTDTTVADFIIRAIMPGIQENLGDINYFDIQEDIRGGVTYLHIVDRKVIPSKNDIKTKLDLVGLSTEVSNLNITSKISNNLSSMIAIAAQDTYSPSSAEDLYNLQKWNTGLRDRHLKLKVGSSSEFTNQIDVVQEPTDTLRFKLFEYFITFNSLVENTIYTTPDPSGLKSIHRQIMKELVRVNTNTPARTNPPGLIPFELSFTTKGISGIKVGQAFTVNDFFLPERYKGRTGFIVTGVDHTVSENRWDTEIKSQLIFI